MSETPTKDGEPARNPLAEISAESASRLQAESDRLFVESAQLGAQSDLLRAQAEIVRVVIERRAMLAEAEQELDRARRNLARATAAHDPVAADFEQVRAELATIDPDQAPGLEDRLAWRARVYALQQEVGPLQERLAGLEQAVTFAREDVRSWEKDQVPMAQAALSAAVDALVSPPLDDMAKLFELAPEAMRSRVRRVGIHLVNVTNAYTPHGHYTVAALRQFMAYTGQLALFEGFTLDYLKSRLDPKTFAKVQQAMAPPEPDLYQPEPVTADRARSDMRSLAGTRQGDLPAYDSPEGLAMRQGYNSAVERYRGPASWPSFGGVRAPL
ncbi:MAG: hypothetical protein WAL12_21025 [Trebonia sp.]